MPAQLHRRFTDGQVKLLLDLYGKRIISLAQALQQLGCSRPRFYQLLKQYQEAPEEFTIRYARHTPQHCLSERVDRIIREELEKDKQLISDKDIPVWHYNYRAVRDMVVKRVRREISAQTIRNRARKWGYWRPKKKVEKRIPREVATEAVGMLLQHDASTHRWSPYVSVPWDLITTLDDHSRYLLFADFVPKESTWAHIKALRYVVLRYGIGLSYYVDSYRVFRYVCHGQSYWHRQHMITDQVPTQWQRVIEKCHMQVIFAISAQAKGKVERPYRWLQDRIVRRCAHDHITDLEQARLILQDECRRYNEHQIHSTTGEIPAVRFHRAVREGRTCFQPFKLTAPYTSEKDIFCLHEARKVDGYNQITWEGYKIRVPIHVPRKTEIELHIIPHRQRTEVRLWHSDRVIKVVHCKTYSG
jgi:hypothetical protein